MSTPDFTANSVEYINLMSGNEGHSDLLRLAYDRVFTPAFPIADERVPIETFQHKLDRPQTASMQYNFIIAGRELDNLGNAEILGFSSGIFYPKACAGLICYNAVDPASQGAKIGTHMISALRRDFAQSAANYNVDLKAVFVEVNDPVKTMSVSDTLDPQVRLDIYKRWGASEVPLAYIQPALHPSQAKFDGLKLLEFPVSGKPAAKGVVRDFLYAMYADCGYVPQEDTAFQQMCSELGVRKLPSCLLKNPSLEKS